MPRRAMPRPRRLDGASCATFNGRIRPPPPGARSPRPCQREEPRVGTIRIACAQVARNVTGSRPPTASSAGDLARNAVGDVGADVGVERRLRPRSARRRSPSSRIGRGRSSAAGSRAGCATLTASGLLNTTTALAVPPGTTSGRGAGAPSGGPSTATRPRSAAEHRLARGAQRPARASRRSPAPSVRAPGDAAVARRHGRLGRRRIEVHSGGTIVAGRPPGRPGAHRDRRHGHASMGRLATLEQRLLGDRAVPRRRRPPRWARPAPRPGAPSTAGSSDPVPALELAQQAAAGQVEVDRRHRDRAG